MIEIFIILIVIFFLFIFLTTRKYQKESLSNNVYSAEYYRGLNYLLNDEDDKALKIFTDLIDVDSSTIETHLALGGVYRRRGEFDKAILIHQNLLSRPKLDRGIKNQTLYELGKDFFSAGLYDKSEKILLNLKNNKSYEESCSEYLLLIYELSKDWDTAIKFTKNINNDKIRNLSINHLISQYYCEKAYEYQKDNQLNKAITVLRKAININDSSSRPFSMLFKINIHSNPTISLDNLLNLVRIDSSFLVILSNEIIELSTIHQDKDIDKKISNIILEFSKEDQFSPQIYEFMFNINNYSSPNEYINRTKNNIFTDIFDNLYSEKSMNSNESKTNLDLLTLISNNFLTYSCSNCGHSVKNHIWQCPSCNHWETFRPNTISDRVAIND
jgi:lipopolysaccharide biosynthesis regulator YciM